MLDEKLSNNSSDLHKPAGDAYALAEARRAALAEVDNAKFKSVDFLLGTLADTYYYAAGSMSRSAS